MVIETSMLRSEPRGGGMFVEPAHDRSASPVGATWLSVVAVQTVVNMPPLRGWIVFVGRGTTDMPPLWGWTVFARRVLESIRATSYTHGLPHGTTSPGPRTTAPTPLRNFYVVAMLGNAGGSV